MARKVTMLFGSTRKPSNGTGGNGNHGGSGGKTYFGDTKTVVISNENVISAIGVRLRDRADEIRFGVDEDGNYGYIKPGADTVIPFKRVEDRIETTRLPVDNWTAQYTGYKLFTPSANKDGMSSLYVRTELLRDGQIINIGSTETPTTVYDGNTAESNAVKLLKVSPSKEGYGLTNSYWYMKPSSVVGNAAAGDVLSGKTFSSGNGWVLTGTMSDYGTYTNSITVTPYVRNSSGTTVTSITANGTYTVVNNNTQTKSGLNGRVTGIQTVTSGSSTFTVNITPALESRTENVSYSVDSWSYQYTSYTTYTPSSGKDGISSIKIRSELLRDHQLLNIGATETPATVYNGNTAESNSTKLLRVSPSKDGYGFTGSYWDIKATSTIGNAATGDVLTGKTFSSGNGWVLTGTLSDYGTLSNAITVNPAVRNSSGTTVTNITANGTYTAFNNNTQTRSSLNGRVTAVQTTTTGTSTFTVNVTPALETRTVTADLTKGGNTDQYTAYNTYTPTSGRDGISNFKIRTEQLRYAQLGTIGGTDTPSTVYSGNNAVSNSTKLLYITPTKDGYAFTSHRLYLRTTSALGNAGTGSVLSGVTFSSLNGWAITGTLSDYGTYTNSITVTPILKNSGGTVVTSVTSNGTYFISNDNTQTKTGLNGRVTGITTVTSGSKSFTVSVTPSLETREVSPDFSVSGWTSQYTAYTTYTPSSGKDGISSIKVRTELLRDGQLLNSSTVTTPSTVYNGNTSESNTIKLLRVAPTKNGYGKTSSYWYLKPSALIGNAAAANVLAGKTFSSSVGWAVSGALADLGDKTYNIDPDPIVKDSSGTIKTTITANGTYNIVADSGMQTTLNGRVGKLTISVSGNNPLVVDVGTDLHLVWTNPNLSSSYGVVTTSFAAQTITLNSIMDLSNAYKYKMLIIECQRSSNGTRRSKRINMYYLPYATSSATVASTTSEGALYASMQISSNTTSYDGNNSTGYKGIIYSATTVSSYTSQYTWNGGWCVTLSDTSYYNRQIFFVNSSTRSLRIGSAYYFNSATVDNTKCIPTRIWVSTSGGPAESLLRF